MCKAFKVVQGLDPIGEKDMVIKVVVASEGKDIKK